jgi:hypothetical protein
VATLAYQQVVQTGLQPTYSAATVTVGDSVVPDDDGFVHIKNSSGSPITATVTTPGVGPGGVAVPDIPVASIPATTGTAFVGPLNSALADPTTGLVTVICSAVGSVTIAAMRM